MQPGRTTTAAAEYFSNDRNHCGRLNVGERRQESRDKTEFNEWREERRRNHISVDCQKQRKFNSKNIEQAEISCETIRRKDSHSRTEIISQPKTDPLSAVMSPASAGSCRRCTASPFSSSSSSLTSSCKFLLLIWMLFISVTNVCCELNTNCKLIWNTKELWHWAICFGSYQKSCQCCGFLEIL